MRGTPCNFWEGNSINNTKSNKYKALPKAPLRTRLLRFAKTVSLDFSAPLRYCVFSRRSENGEKLWAALDKQKKKPSST